MSTVPDMGLESHIFIQRLAGAGSDVQSRFHLHDEIEKWLHKMHNWHGPGCEWIAKTDPLIAPHLGRLLTLGDDAGALSAECKKAETDTPKKILGVENAAKKMMQNLVDRKLPQDELLQRQASVASWKEEKIAALEATLATLRKQLTEIYANITVHMDKLIDAAQENESMPAGETGAVDDPMMAELEEMMSQAFPMTKAEPVEEDQPPDQEMVQETPEQSALRHIGSMEDGPMKSALLALCEASSTKVGHINIWNLHAW